jgi:ketosteroid isomerase-like protein
MLHIFLAAALLVGPPDRPPLMAPVTAWVQAFNSGQVAFPSDAFTDDCTVIDEFPPFAWSRDRVNVRTWYAVVIGATSPQKRARFFSYHQRLTLAEPTYMRMKDGGANIAFPATLDYVEKGKHHVQRAMFTVSERKTPDGWRISAHAWAITSDD